MVQDQDTFAAWLEAAPDAMVVIDAGGVIQLVNRHTEALFGYSREELIGQAVEMLLPERYRARHRAYRTRYAERPEVRIMGSFAAPGESMREPIGRRADGREFPVEVAIGPMTTATGTRIVASVRDLTSRWQAEDRVRNLASVAESSDDAMIVVDLSGNVTAWNRGAEAAYGYVEADVVGRPVEVLAHRFRQKELATVLARVARGDRVEPYETKAVHKDGTFLDVSIRVSPVFDSQGSVVAASIVARDMTETVSVRDALALALYDRSRQTAELARRNHHLALINVMSELLGRTESAGEAHEIAGRLGSRLFPDVGGTIFVRQPEDATMEAVAAWGEEGTETEFAPEDCEAVSGQRSWVWHDDDSGAPRCRHIHPEVVAYQCVPLLDRGQSIGSISLTTTIPPSLQTSFDETDEALAETFAENLAMTLSNLRLREILGDRADPEELYDVFGRELPDESDPGT